MIRLSWLPGQQVNGFISGTLLCVTFIIFSVLMPGCQAVISQEIRIQADESLSFTEVFQRPDEYQGRIILWGGQIIKIRNTRQGAVLEVLEYPLGSGDRPRVRQKPGGRFLVHHDDFLDPAVYEAGKEVTVVGEVAGARQEVLDEVEYIYPVVKELELYLWTHRRSPPRFHIGIGATFGR